MERASLVEWGEMAFRRLWARRWDGKGEGGGKMVVGTHLISGGHLVTRSLARYLGRFSIFRTLCLLCCVRVVVGGCALHAHGLRVVAVAFVSRLGP